MLTLDECQDLVAERLSVEEACYSGDCIYGQYDEGYGEPTEAHLACKGTGKVQVWPLRVECPKWSHQIMMEEAARGGDRKCMGCGGKGYIPSTDTMELLRVHPAAATVLFDAADDVLMNETDPELAIWRAAAALVEKTP